jgi:ABC-type sugar transport system ATPase subunit
LKRLGGGSVWIGGQRIASSRDARRKKIAFLPRDRKSEGIFGPLSVADNIMASSLPTVSSFGVLLWAKFMATARSLVAAMKVKTAGLASPISSLSGGNQQKALLGRLMATGPRVLVLNDPMRGVDLGAKRDLYEALTAASDRGIAVLLLSTELTELCMLCDRVAVFHDQSVIRTMNRDELSEQGLIDAMFGQLNQEAEHAR